MAGFSRTQAIKAAEQLRTERPDTEAHIARFCEPFCPSLSLDALECEVLRAIAAWREEIKL